MKICFSYLNCRGRLVLPSTKNRWCKEKPPGGSVFFIQRDVRDGLGPMLIGAAAQINRISGARLARAVFFSNRYFIFFALQLMTRFTA